VAPISAGSVVGVEPEFVRIPDVRRLFGIRRGFLYQLIGAGRVRSICLRTRGSRGGVRLIQFSSLKKFLADELEKNQRGPEMKGNA